MEFKHVASFSSRLEAETVGHTLDKYGIPFMIKSNDIGGIFGSGSSGSSDGASLLVPDGYTNQADEALTGLVESAKD